eukprot:2668082-Prymnesium_polylepis.1
MNVGPPPKQPQLPPLLPLVQARAIRAACLHASWHAANLHVGYEEDAARDLAALEQLKSSLSESCGPELADCIEQLVLSAAWSAVHTINDDDDEAEASAAKFAEHRSELESFVSEDTAPL